MARPDRGDDDSGLRGGYGKAYEIIAAAIQFAVVVILMVFLGLWLDGRFGSSPWLMIAGLAVGFAAGFTVFLRTVQRAAENNDPKKEEK